MAAEEQGLHAERWAQALIDARQLGRYAAGADQSLREFQPVAVVYNPEPKGQSLIEVKDSPTADQGGAGRWCWRTRRPEGGR